MRTCLFCGIDISAAHGRAKYCCPSHRVQHANGVIYDPNKVVKRGRPPKDATKAISDKDATIPKQADVPPKQETKNKPDLAPELAEAAPQAAEPQKTPEMGQEKPYMAHPAYPFDFANDGKMLNVEKYSIYPLNKRPANIHERKAYEIQKKKSDDLIRNAFYDYHSKK